MKKPKATPSPTPEPEDDNSNSTNNSMSNSNSDDEAAGSGTKKACDGGAVYEVWVDDIQKTMDDINEFTPDRDYFVRDFNDNQNKYLKAALKPSEREDWLKNWEPEIRKCLNDKFDELKALADKKIGTYTPHGYTLGTPADKAALRAAVTDIAQAQVFQVGVKDMTWKILYNDIGIPTGRKKLGKLWLKYPNSKYCTIVWANVWQPYAGGGTYGASQRDFIAWEYAGCPAGK